MIDKSDYLYAESLRSICTYDCVIAGLDNLPPTGILWQPNDDILQLFKAIWDKPGPYVIVSGGSDFGLHYQADHPVNPDIEKALCRFDFDDFNARKDVYLHLHLPPACVMENCHPSDKYSLRCYHYTHATFDAIPPCVKYWYAANVNISPHINPSIECFPLGILDNNIEYKYTQDKTSLFYVNLSNITRERMALKERFGKCSWATVKDKVPLDEYIQDLSEHLFVLSPEGNGVSNYREVEVMLSGSVVVTKLTEHTKYFSDMPYLYISDYNVISEDMLKEAVKQLPSNKFSLERITAPYWKNRILAKWQEINS